MLQTFNQWFAQRNHLQQTLIKTTAAMLLFVLMGGGVLILTQTLTAPVIAEQQRLTQLRALNEIIPKEVYNNDPLQDQMTLKAKQYLGLEQSQVYVFKKDQQRVALVFSLVAPDGYSGEIHLLMGVYRNGEVAAVRVTQHMETPGLGDKIEVKKSDWIFRFNQKSLTTENQKAWAVKKDGGNFDQFTGATITPRAVVKAVKNALIYLQQHPEIWQE